LLFALITLLTALVISSVAIYYSVSGLAAIFAASAIPIIIMGMSLEIGKLVTAVWLHKNWNSAPKILRTYFMIATLVLMFITSMGIFGFLSRAHIEQSAPIGDVAAQIEMIDAKIQTKKEEITNAQTTIKGLDEVVNQYLTKGTDVKSVTSANSARKQNSGERNKLQKQIDQIQKDIAKLNEEKFPLSQQIRKAEAEVGPIKYIAQMIYGDNPDKNLLEKAVTWMIFVIIFVFDPLAVLLLIASQIGFEQASEHKKFVKAEAERVKREAAEEEERIKREKEEESERRRLAKEAEQERKRKEIAAEEERQRLEEEAVAERKQREAEARAERKRQEAEAEMKRLEAEAEVARLKIAAEEAERRRIEEESNARKILEQEIELAKELAAKAVVVETPKPIRKPRVKKEVKLEEVLSPEPVKETVIEDTISDLDAWNKMIEEAERAAAEEKILREPKPPKKKETYIMKDGNRQVKVPKK